MKKRIIMIVIFIIILLMIGYLYNTFALSSIITNDNDSYSIVINGNDSIEIAAKSSKTIYYKITNSNNGKVKYGVGYTGTDVIAKAYEDYSEEVSGIMNYGENKFIKLKLINNGTTANTITLKTILGYENGGDLIVPSGYTLITAKVSSNNVIRGAESSISDTSNFLNTDIVRNTIETLTVTNDNIVPVDVLGSFDISQNGDGSIMMWYTDTDNNGLYEVSIGSENGIVKASTNGNYMFAYLDNVESLDLTRLDTSNMTNMSRMFYNSTSLKSIDLSNFDTSKVTTMFHMFENCTNLTSLDLSSFNTSNVTDMEGMFQNNTNLKEIKFGNNFKTNKVTTMLAMFASCSNLKQLDLSNFDTSNVTSMQSMFYKCENMESLDLSSFKTNKVTKMNYMFMYCTNLKTINLDYFNTSIVTTMQNMFYFCKSLENLNLSTFTTDNLTTITGMFDSCTSLKSLDIRNADLSIVSKNSDVFNQINSSVIVYVKNDTEKEYIKNNIKNIVSDNVIVG